jgi:arginyl-tRNA synthetase
MIVRERVAAALTDAVRGAQEAGEAPSRPVTVRLDVPPSAEIGDFSSDVALELAAGTGLAPAQVAAVVAARLAPPPAPIARVDVTPSGLLNVRLTAGWAEEVIREARALGDAFGRSEEPGGGLPLHVEFVSAEPTGPLTVLHGRGAALGDAVANLMEWNGYRVSREFYVNDAGSQAERFGRSLAARYLQLRGDTSARVPVDGYVDDDVEQTAARISTEHGDELRSLSPDERAAACRRLGRDAMVERQRATLQAMGVRFDRWFAESDLIESGKVAETVALLQERGHAYEAEDATWLRSSAFGDEQDRPLLRSNGRPTYMAADLAYHLDKVRRGFARLIDVWGPDHAGYVERTRAGIGALGCDNDALSILIFQPVTLKLDGSLIEAGAYSGNNILLGEVIDEVGADNARFLYLLRPLGAPLEFDLDLARQASGENPLVRIRTVQARIAELAGAGPGTGEPEAVDLSSLHPAGRALVRKIVDFPDEVRAAGRELEPHRLVRYTSELAVLFEEFDRSESWEGGCAGPRAAVVEAAGVALRNALSVLGIPSPV